MRAERLLEQSLALLIAAVAATVHAIRPVAKTARRTTRALSAATRHRLRVLAAMAVPLAGRATLRLAGGSVRSAGVTRRQLRRTWEQMRREAPGWVAEQERNAPERVRRTLHRVRADGPEWAGMAQRQTIRGMSGMGLALVRAVGMSRVATRAMAIEIAHQVEASSDPTPHFRPLRDRRGRRLRASVYRRHRGAARRGGDLAATAEAVRFRRIAGVALFTVLLTGGSFMGTSRMFVSYAANLPTVHSLRTTPLPEDSLIYSGDGQVVADLHTPGLFHYYEPLDQMGEWLPEAMIAIEDSNFWNEPGVDPQGIARAAWSDWKAKRTEQGASTITQQLVKIRLLKDSSQTLDRKVKEAILAVQVEHVYPKRQILEMYLNSVHFGNQSLGAQAAAQNYFRKDVRDLDLAEASMLAGIPQSPYYNDPTRNWDIAKGRQHEVLDAMVKDRVVTKLEADQAFAEDLRPQLHYPPDSVRAAPGYVGWVKSQLVDRYGQQTVLEGGLRVYTALNPQLQAMAEADVRSNVMSTLGKNIHQGAMTAIDPRTGEVMAMVGSAFPDWPGGQYNYAAFIPRNPGSSFKVFTYSAGIESLKYSMTTPIHDVPVTVNQPGQSPGYRPLNYDRGWHGTCQFQQCIGNSLNVPAVQVELGTGIPQVVDMARKLGAPPYFLHQDGTYTQDDPDTAFAAPLTLGAYGETPLQMATGVATLADMGLYHPPTGILRVDTVDGGEIFKYDPAQAARQVVDPRVAFIMASILSNDNNRAAIFGRGSALTLPGRPVAAKTGTAEDFVDAYTIGFTPAIASAFWFGNPDGSPMQSGYDAIFAAAPAWHLFMHQATDFIHESPADWYAPPPGIGSGPPGVWLMPGTRDAQPAPPLPPWASLGSAPAKPAPRG